MGLRGRTCDDEYRKADDWLLIGLRVYWWSSGVIIYIGVCYSPHSGLAISWIFDSAKVVRRRVK